MIDNFADCRGFGIVHVDDAFVVAHGVMIDVGIGAMELVEGEFSAQEPWIGAIEDDAQIDVFGAIGDIVHDAFGAIEE